MRIPWFQVDAFAEQPFTGNPAAVCPLDLWLDDRMLRKVAAENNLSATAFFVHQGNQYELRWFTPQCEIRLCGHATLAAGYVVLNILQPGIDTVRFETRFSGMLTVCRNGDLFAMDFPAMLAETCAKPPDTLVHALGPGPPPSEVLEVNDTYVAVYETESAIRNFRPDFARLEKLRPFAVALTNVLDNVADTAPQANDIA